MSQYHCIFQSSSSHIYSTSAGILAVSDNGTGYIYCTNHCNANESLHTDYKTEGLFNILEKCTGHRLAVTNYRGKAPDEIKPNEHITSKQYNCLADLIETELLARKASPLYKKAEISPEKPVVDSSRTIRREQLSALNSYLESSGFYKDKMKLPAIMQISADEANATDINKTIATVKMMLNDCICYSDCNSYSSCLCYGNCNHY